MIIKIGVCVIFERLSEI